MGNDPASALAAAGPPRERLWATVDALEQALVAPAPGRVEAWRDRTTVSLDALRSEWRDHVRVTEDEDGLFAEIMAREPRLAHAIDVLRREHTTLAGDIDTVADAIRSVEDEPGVARIRGELVELVGRLSLHRHRGVDLVYSAYDADISAGD